MLQLVRSEVRKVFPSLMWVALLGLGLALAIITIITEFNSAAEAGGGASGIPSEQGPILAGYWMSVHLAASIVAALMVTREQDSGAIERTLLFASSSRQRTLWSKTLASLVVVAPMALLAGLLSLFTPTILAAVTDFEPGNESYPWTTALGLFGICLLAAPWGVFIGIICRSSIIAALVLVFTTLVVDVFLIGSVPVVGRMTFTVALSSVYGGETAGNLEFLPGLAVAMIWLVIGGALASLVFSRREFK